MKQFFLLNLFLICSLLELEAQQLIMKEYASENKILRYKKVAYRKDNNFNVKVSDYCNEIILLSPTLKSQFNAESYDSIITYDIMNGGYERRLRKLTNYFNASGKLDSTIEIRFNSTLPIISASKHYEYYLDSVIIKSKVSSYAMLYKCVYGANNLRDTMVYAVEGDSLKFLYRNIHLQTGRYLHSEIMGVTENNGVFDTSSAFNFKLNQDLNILVGFQYNSNSLIKSPLVMTAKYYNFYNVDNNIAYSEYYAPFDSNINFFFKHDSILVFYTGDRIDSIAHYMKPYTTSNQQGLAPFELTQSMTFEYNKDNELIARNYIGNSNYIPRIEFEYIKKDIPIPVVPAVIESIIYPNPNSTNTLSIKSPTLVNEVLILDMLGRLYSMRAVDQKVDISNLARGVYIISFIVDEKPFQQKLIVD